MPKLRSDARQKSEIRCAIYTRKSSEEGLEQDFNSLDAQREACDAFVRSQKHEGWTTLPALYDDGGISGATMDRPALQRLLNDIDAGCIDTVVVYKVDRLTRSLSDFSKIVEVFDNANVSFVSVTQAFNTTTSMGRLTLNMLLSFAQFEREVTGERIRDKIAASKKKGMWMGGLPPLGYDVEDKKLVVNAVEADTVQMIFRRYTELGSVRALKQDLDDHGVISKIRVNKHGRRSGGKPLARGALYAMLQNRIYLGEIVHKESSYPGEHAAIIDVALWNQVQQRLADNRHDRQTGVHASEPSLLAGLLYDEAGIRMIPSHTSKKRRRYRYYVSQSLIKRGRQDGLDAALRIPAGDIEHLICDRIAAFLSTEATIYEAIEPLIQDPNERLAITKRAAKLGQRWPGLELSKKRDLLQGLTDRIEVRRDRFEIKLRLHGLIDVMQLGERTAASNMAVSDDKPILTLTVPAQLRRAGMETRYLLDGADQSPRKSPDRSMLRLLAQAHRYRNMMFDAQGRTLNDVARQAGVGRSYFCRVVRLSFLAPDIMQTLLHGMYPPELTAKQITLHIKLPNAWDDQKAALGFV